MTRFQTYQIGQNFITVDTQNESAPEEFVAGPFDITVDEAEQIEQGASIEIVDDQAVVIIEGEGV